MTSTVWASGFEPRLDAPNRLNCGPGTKQCGRRCIPQDYDCRLEYKAQAASSKAHMGARVALAGGAIAGLGALSNAGVFGKRAQSMTGLNSGLLTAGTLVTAGGAGQILSGLGKQAEIGFEQRRIQRQAQAVRREQQRQKPKSVAPNVKPTQPEEASDFDRDAFMARLQKNASRLKEMRQQQLLEYEEVDRELRGALGESMRRSRTTRPKYPRRSQTPFGSR